MGLRWFQIFGEPIQSLENDNILFELRFKIIKNTNNYLPNVEIITFPVFPESVKTDDWWNYSGTRDLLIMEYLKFLAVSLRVNLNIFS